jgi:phosphosulfolactate phosphohydrolase-like enzyme
MALIDHIEFHKKWFAESIPQNAKAATGSISFVGTVGEDEIVVIGDETYEFTASDTVTAGRIAVDISGGATASDAVTALAAAIESESSIVSAADGTGDKVDIESLLVGDDYEYVTTTNCVSATFAANTMSGGQYAVPAKTASLIKLSDVYYMTEGAVTRYDTDGWFSLAATTL